MPLAPLLLALTTATWAAPASEAVVASLLDPAGWSTPQNKKGVLVSTKEVPGLPVPAFKGTRTFDIDCADYFANVADPSRHAKVNDMLVTSRVVKREGDEVVFFQVLDLPLISDRWWINRARNERDVDGQAGHFRQVWWSLSPDDWPAIKAEAEDRYDAVYTPVNYGYWDLVPAGSGRCTVTYAVASDPGGNIPGGAANWASEKSLPANLQSFYEAAKR